MDLGAEREAQLIAAVTPSPADVLIAKRIAFDLLEQRTRLDIDGLFTHLCQQAGVDSHTGNHDHLEVDGVARGLGRHFDPDAPVLVRERLRASAVEAFADLVNHQAIVPIEPDFKVRVGIKDLNTRGGTDIPLPRSRVSVGPHRLIGTPAGTDFRFFDAELYLDGIDDLLGKRGCRCLGEALDAYRRGLYLSSVNMLGATSEAAWYTIAAAVAQPPAKLAAAIAGDVTAQVIKLTLDHLHTLPGKKPIVLHELGAHAAHLRDLRNYGLHPRDDEDADMEAAFTEFGCALLLMESRRYLVRLRGVAVDAGLLT
ncbi:hypothetical protein ACQEVB_11750 [Pseudonocardia sp. CA-107938]|uniref:hypothetical protein n=1 Tax=Pseudonocardia sp. CA-107938 TaxID=3240021 RepID=UPI003D8D61BD